MLHEAFWDRRCGGDAADDAADDAATFEEVYPRYEFAELVRLAMAAGAWLVKLRRRSEPRSEIAINPLPGDMNPAE